MCCIYGIPNKWHVLCFAEVAAFQHFDQIREILENRRCNTSAEPTERRASPRPYWAADGGQRVRQIARLLRPDSASLRNGPIYIGPWIQPARPSTSSSRPGAMPSAKHSLQMARWRVGGIRPRVINVDGHAAYPLAIRKLKASGELGQQCQCRPTPYLNASSEESVGDFVRVPRRSARAAEHDAG